MTDPFPTTEGVHQAFQKVKELQDLHVLIQSRLAALCAGAARAAVSPEAEYKALRDEMIHLFNRVFVLLAAMVGGSVVVFNRALDLRDAHPLRAWGLVVVMSCTLVVGMVLTYKIYDHIYKIRWYIVVYHEDGVGWHLRAGDIIDYLRTFPVPNRWFYSFGEPDAIAVLYAALVLFAAATVSFLTPLALGGALSVPKLGLWEQSAVVFGVLVMGFSFVFWKLRRVYATSRGSWEKWWRAFKRAKEAEAVEKALHEKNR